MSQKFHINSAGDVRVCNATVKVCRFESSDHFTDRTQAQEAIEKRLSNEYTKINTLSKPVGFNKRILELAINQKPTPEELMEIGELFDSEVSKRVGFNILDHELGEDEYRKIQKVNQEIFRELAETDGDLTNVKGSLSKSLNQAVKILPNNIKESVGAAPIFTKALNKNNRSRDGYHKLGNIEVSVEAVSNVSPSMIHPDTPNGGTMPAERHLKSDYLRPGTSFRAVIKDGENYERLKAVWIGEPLRRKGFKKIKSKAEIYIDGEKHILDKNVYAMQDTEFRYGSEIAVKKSYESNEFNSLLLHEYCHAVEYRSNLMKDEEGEMFEKLAGEKKFSFELSEVVHKGFPDDYMGYKTGKELFPVSTEAFFYPAQGDRMFLYGSDRGENADQVRQWVSGLWVSLAKRTKS